MAIYHMSIKILSRSTGRSGVASAAFRARTRIHDERQGLTFNYSSKADLDYSEIMLPDGAPSWMMDRYKLWNAVEAGEKRKDAQIYREVEAALPLELDRKQRIALVREFVKDKFVSEGMVADINIHQDKGNPHAHIMLTMRYVTAGGFGMKNRSWNQRALIFKWRKGWADIQNRHLRKAGYDITVDHRSYKDRGIDLEPQIKMGPSTYNSDADLEQVKEFKRIKRDNGKRIVEYPSIALKVLSLNSKLFTDEDVQQFAQSHSEGRKQFQAVCDAIYNCSELITLGANSDNLKKYTVRETVKTNDSMNAGSNRKRPLERDYI